MADFPSLIPDERNYSIGVLPMERRTWLSGADQRATFGDSITVHQLTLRWVKAPAASGDAIESHYHGQQGETNTFDIPATVWCGHTRYDEIDTASLSWRYDGPPQFDDYSAGVRDVTVQLVAVSAQPRKSTGSSIDGNIEGTLVASAAPS